MVKLKSFIPGKTGAMISRVCCRCVTIVSLVTNPQLPGCLPRFVVVAVRAVLQGDVLLIALRGRAQSAIEELVQQSQQFHLAVNFDRAAHEALALQEFPEMSLGENYCPAQVGKRDPLGGAALTELKITLLDVLARLGEQPLAKVPQDFLDSSPQFLDGDFAQISGARGSFSLAINSAASSSECRSITRTNPNAIMQPSLFDSMRILGESTQVKAGATPEFL